MPNCNSMKQTHATAPNKPPWRSSRCPASLTSSKLLSTRAIASSSAAWARVTGIIVIIPNTRELIDSMRWRNSELYCFIRALSASRIPITMGISRKNTGTNTGMRMAVTVSATRMLTTAKVPASINWRLICSMDSTSRSTFVCNAPELRRLW